MLKKVFVFIYLITPLLVSSQIRERLNQTDLERRNLNNKVKILVHKYYDVKNFKDSTYELRIDNFFGPNSYKLVFDQEGYIQNRIGLEGKVDSLYQVTYWNYKYDDKNRILEEERIHFKYEDTVKWTYNYIGDSIIDVRQYDNTYKTLYFKYKQKDRQEILTTSNSDSSYISKSLFEYDKFDRLIRSEEYENKDFIQDLRIYTFKDSTSNQRFKELIIWPKFNDSFFMVFDYDQYGNQISWKQEWFDREEISTSRTEYEYDSENNWIEKRFFNYENKLIHVVKREITYF